MDNRQRLIELFQQHALKYGEFQLASGKTSHYYLDGKQITLQAEGLRLVSEGVMTLLDGVACDAIGGMSIGADPIVGGVLAVAATQGRNLRGFMVRKEAKGHGTKKFLEGPVEAGQKVVIVDDVVTTGGSSILAIERAREFGCEVVLAIGIVDRLQGGAENFAKHNVPFQSLLTIRDLGVNPEGSA